MYMQTQVITKLETQTVFDLLLLHAGGISGLFEFLNLNKQTDLNLTDGDYFFKEVINQDIVNALKLV